MAQISAVLGQRLSLKVPVVGTGAGNLTADCVRLSDPISSEGAPVLRQASIKVVQQETGPLIEVVTSDPVTEPAVRLALDVGCSDPLRREYAILLGLPPLAAAGPAAEAAVPSEPAAPPVTRPVPKRAAPTPPHAAALPVAPTPESAAVKPAPVRTEQPPVPKPATRPPEADRLVLSAPQQAAPAAAAAAEAQALQNAELLKRLDTMSKEIEMLRAELNASRQHEREMERRLSESREGWTWLMGAMGGVLLGGALVIAWRRQRSPQPSWEPSASAARRAPTTIAPAPRAAVAAAAAVPGIGGRATMAPAPTTINATTDMPDERHTDITVTELHDTVQVIKELYATVLERNTSSAAPAGGQRRPRPLDLDLKPPPASSPEATPPQVLGDAVQGVQRPTSGERLAEAQDPQFTELPTEVAMDLDLSTLVMPAAPMLTAEELAARNAGAPASHAPQPGLGDSSQATAAPGAVAARRAPASDAAPASRIVLTELPTRAGFADDQLTQTPTEVSIDIDLGEPSRNTVNQPATRVVPLQRADAERKNTGPAPFDLQLDLDQPETKNKPRGEKSA
jgi:hypothetical protein